MEQLTVQKLKAMEPGAIFATGTTTDNSVWINIWSTGTKIKWVAVRGHWYHDRTVYLRGDRNELDIDESDDSIARFGDKCPETSVLHIIDADQKALKLYRS